MARLSVYLQERTQLIALGELIPDKTLQGCEENRHYLIRTDAQTSRLYIDDALLPMDTRGEFWLWSPGFYAGEVEVELEQQGRHAPTRFLIDVAPAHHKTGHEQYVEYIAQIVAYAPELLTGTEPAKHGLGGHSAHQRSLWIRYARFRRFVGRYLAGLKTITEQPITRLEHHREQLPLHMVRRVDATTARRLGTNPALLGVIAGKRDELQERMIALNLRDNCLDAPFNEPTLDNPANREMAAQLAEVLRSNNILINAFANHGTTPGQTESDIRARIPRRLEYLASTQEQLLKLSKSPPFNTANSSKRGVAGLNAVSGNPHYAYAYQAGTRLLRQGIAELLDDERHYLAPTWEIYEAWCFVTLAKQLESQLNEYEWRMHETTASTDKRLVGNYGEHRVSLYSQLVCRSMENENRYGYCSISRERRPDLVLEYRNGSEIRYICLDSKYTSHRSRILESMASAHIYKDSIKCRGMRPLLSVLLVPANQEVHRLTSPEYLESYGVGCLTLSNNNEAQAILKQLLDTLIPSTKQ